MSVAVGRVEVRAMCRDLAAGGRVTLGCKNVGLIRGPQQADGLVISGISLVRRYGT